MSKKISTFQKVALTALATMVVSSAINPTIFTLLKQEQGLRIQLQQSGQLKIPSVNPHGNFINSEALFPSPRPHQHSRDYPPNKTPLFHMAALILDSSMANSPNQKTGMLPPHYATQSLQKSF